MPKESKREQENTFNMRPCPHGSLFCFCRHNLVAAIALPGHAPYPRSNGARKTGKKGKMRKRKVSVANLI